MKNLDKILLIDKPEGMTSHDVVDKVREATGEKCVGHAGTLDPMASGLLIVLVGREMTKRQSEFMKQDKVYEAEIALGAVSDTYDKEGRIQLSIHNFQFLIKEEDVKKIIKENFTGEIEQIPPMYSAVKVKGKKLYQYARKGQKVEIKPRKIFIYDVKILNLQGNTLTLRIHCSSGTYIRSIAHDLGQKLGCGGYLNQLRRIKIGEFTVEDAIRLAAI